MLTNFEMLEKANTTVCQTTILLQAAITCDLLENAGIPAILRQTLSPAGGHFMVDVPRAHAVEAHHLLFGHPGQGEIFFTTD